MGESSITNRVFSSIIVNIKGLGNYLITSFRRVSLGDFIRFFSTPNPR